MISSVSIFSLYLPYKIKLKKYMKLNFIHKTLILLVLICCASIVMVFKGESLKLLIIFNIFMGFIARQVFISNKSTVSTIMHDSFITFLCATMMSYVLYGKLLDDFSISYIIGHVVSTMTIIPSIKQK